MTGNSTIALSDSSSNASDLSCAVHYDLGRKLYLSNRAHLKPIGDKSVAYNPDYPGGPLLLSSCASRLLRRFATGVQIGTALAEESISFETGLAIIDNLYDRGFLRASVNPARYSADERLDNPISSISIWVHINNHCNLDCSYCFVNKYKAEMSDEVIARSVANIAATVKHRNIRTLNIAYAGGEPTISLPKIEKFSQALTSALEGTGAWCHQAILTNGTILSDRLIEFCTKNKVSIGISLDGYGESHDVHRVFTRSRKGSWSIIEKNITKLIACGIKPYVMAVTSAETSSTLPELVRWVADRELMLRISVVRQPDGVWAPKDWQRAYKKLIGILVPNFERAFNVLEEEKYAYDWARKIRICELHIETPSFSTSCGIGSSHIIIQDDGNLASCPMTIREQVIPQTEDLVLSTSRTITISPRSRNGSEEKNCLDCRWFPVCVSGCPVTNERVKRTPYTVSPMHEFYEYVIPRFVDFLGTKMYQEARRRDVQHLEIIDEGMLN